MLRYKQYHQSVGIGFFAVGLLAGLSYANASGLQSYTSPLIYVVLIGLSLILLIKVRAVSIMLLIMIAFAIGYMRGSDVRLLQSQLAALSGSEIIARGNVYDDPQTTSNGVTRLVIHNIAIDSVSYSGTIWVETRRESKIGRGDTISIVGKAKPGFGTHQLTMSYVDIDDIVPSNDPVTKLRDSFADGVRSVVVEPAASLGIGFVIGQKSSLSPQLEEQLRIVGLTHLVVASGYNLTILMRFAKRLFERHSKYLVVAVSSSLMTGFVAVSGASPSMVRASLVAGLSLVAWYYGRRFHPVLLLLYVAAVTAMIQPNYIWADLGWWLSFLAFFGVLVLSPLALNILFTKRKPSPIFQIVSESVSAQVMTLPLILLVFGSLPTLAVFANLLSAPLIPLAMVATFLAGISAMAIPSLSAMIGIVAEIILSYFIAVVRWLASPAWAQLDTSITFASMIVIYVAIVGTVAVAWRKARYDFRSSSIID